MTLSLILAALIPAAPLQADPGRACRPEIAASAPRCRAPGVWPAWKPAAPSSPGPARIS